MVFSARNHCRQASSVDWKNRSFQDCDGNAPVPSHKQVSKASPNAQFYGGNEVIDQIANLCKGHAVVQDLLHSHRVQSENPLGADATVTPVRTDPWLQVPWSGWGPGNLGWTPVVSQQAGLPCQMLSEGFWAAAHLSLHCQSSSTSEQHWVTSTVVHVTCVLSWAIES